MRNTSRSRRSWKQKRDSRALQCVEVVASQRHLPNCRSHRSYQLAHKRPALKTGCTFHPYSSYRDTQLYWA